MSPKLRAWLYPVMLAVVPLLIFYGILDEHAAALWVALGGAVLGLGTATAFAPRGRHAKAEE